MAGGKLPCLAALLENLRGAWTESGSRPASLANDWFFSDSDVLGLALDCSLFNIFSFSFSMSSCETSLSPLRRPLLRFFFPPLFFFFFRPGSGGWSAPAAALLLLLESPRRLLPDDLRRRPRGLGLFRPSLLLLESSRSILSFFLPKFSMTFLPRLRLLLRAGGGVLCLGGSGSGVTVSSLLDLGGGGVLGDRLLLLGGRGSGVLVCDRRLLTRLLSGETEGGEGGGDGGRFFGRLAGDCGAGDGGVLGRLPNLKGSGVIVTW